MALFHDNFRYIIKSLSELTETKFSLQSLADILGVQKLTVYGWVSKGKMPIGVSLQAIARATNEKLGWDVDAEDLITTDISKKFSIDYKKEEKERDVELSYSSNIIDFKQISNRLIRLRQERGWALTYVEKKVRDLFPKDKEYWISHTHVADIEKTYVVNYHINKLKALATVYGVTLEYLLFGRKKPKGVTVDKENHVIIIPYGKEFRKMPDDQLHDFAQRLYNMLVNTMPKDIEQYQEE